jgi:hypothetical protein
MYHALMVFAAALLSAYASAAFVRKLKSELRRPTFWLLLFVAAAAGSGTSALYGTTRHAGTGLTSSYGWPKPFYFQYVTETGTGSDGLEVLYFTGNTLFYAAALLFAWTAFRIANRSS